MNAFRGVPIAALAILAWFAVAGAQTVVVDEDVPRETRIPIEASIEAATTVSAADTTFIARGETRSGDLVQIGGTLIVEGTIEGDATAVASHVYIRPGAEVRGRLTVYSGGLYGSTLATIAEGENWIRDAYVETRPGPEDEIHIVHVPPPSPFPIVPRGALGLVLREYNGVDGLAFQIAVGSRSTTRWPRTRFSGGPVFRTERDDVGWDVEVARAFEDGTEFGVRAYSITDTHQRWHRGDLVNSLTSFFLANDDRAYFDLEGYSLWASLPITSIVTAGARWRDDAFDSIRAKRPFAVFAEDEDWRGNPEVTRGDGRALGGWVSLDLRDAVEFPTRGVFARAEIDHWGFGDAFSFDWAQAEARGYLPVGGGSFVSARVVAGGRLGGGETLEPQFLYRLGGRNTIVGYDPLDDRLVGDRMAFVQARVHVAVPASPRFFERLFIVGLADAGDAWTRESEARANTGLGAGVAGAGSKSYLGVFAAYGVESEEWQFYALVQPWF